MTSPSKPEPAKVERCRAGCAELSVRVMARRQQCFPSHMLWDIVEARLVQQGRKLEVARGSQSSLRERDQILLVALAPLLAVAGVMDRSHGFGFRRNKRATLVTTPAPQRLPTIRGQRLRRVNLPSFTTR